MLKKITLTVSRKQRGSPLPARDGLLAFLVALAFYAVPVLIPYQYARMPVCSASPGVWKSEATTLSQTLSPEL